MVDKTIPLECSKKAELEKKMAFQEFVQSYCKVHHYMFSIKKCNQSSKLSSELCQSIHLIQHLIKVVNITRNLTSYMTKWIQQKNIIHLLEIPPKASLPYLSLLQLKMQKIQVQLFSTKNVICGGLFTLSMF